ncbi:hypothetical protein [Chlamydia buteonis]|uniref:ABC transmembrane type-1 domain-containing protein n=1 Tax=Chlamydia buteonis TaxID=2494525 RepID=A0ABX8LDF1_9CHLA|nr:hypothetical protein [Chlamydia buteonis]QXE27033.1 hypothetical protein HBN95_02645 [Chlamydia buteonis]QXE28027.1 hypothetical protein JJJ19_00500 [Chlamydia buteonis]
MLINSYATPADFIAKTRNSPTLIKSAFARQGLKGRITKIIDFTSVKAGLNSLLISSIPVLGTIRGFARIYSIYSVKDRSQDSTLGLIRQTILGTIEIAGFAPALLVLLIATLAALIILSVALVIVIATVAGLAFAGFYAAKKLVGCFTQPSCIR